MVIESIIRSKNPFHVFGLGFFYASFGLFLALALFYDNVSLVMVFLTALASFHFMYVSINNEEDYDIRIANENKLLKRHIHLIVLFLLLFFGFFSAYTFWSIALPAETSNHLFDTQSDAILSVNQVVKAKALSAEHFFPIFTHNIKVLFFFFAFSFLFGAGAIYLLVYNASVGGIFIGSFIQSQLSNFSGFSAVVLGLARYLPHATLEFGGYLFGALAGGIISVALIKRHHATPEFTRILLDASWLIGIAVVTLFFAGIVEVFITGNLVTALSSILS
jgi:uncharacterized membrane protein SpoIIM required for sporulation